MAAEPKDIIYDDDLTSLQLFVVNGEVELVRGLLKVGDDKSVVTKDNETLLHLAAKYGHGEVVGLLLEQGDFQLEAKTIIRRKELDDSLGVFFRRTIVKVYQGYTPLQLAVIKGYTDVVTALIDADADTDVLSRHNESLLHFAAKYGHSEIVGLLLQQDDPKLEAKTLRQEQRYSHNHNRAHTPLQLAVINGHTEVVRSLINAGANTNVLTQDGKSLLHLAAIKGHDTIVSLLLDYIPLEGIDVPNSNLHTPLQYALYYNHQGVIQTLKNKGANVEISLNVTRDGVYKAITVDLSSLPLSVVRFLIKENYIDEKRVFGETVLNDVIGRGNVLVLSFLLGELDLPVNAHLPWREPPICNAVLSGNEDIVRALFEAGADPEVVSKSGSTLLHDAVEKNHAHLIPLLVDYCGQEALEVENRHEMTPLQYAARHGKTETLIALIEAGASIEGALKYAAIGDYIELIPTLMEPRASEEEIHDALRKAVSHGRLNFIQVLVDEHNADLNAAVTDRGLTLLHLACINLRTEIVDYLLKKLGRDIIDKKTDDGKSAKDFASETRKKLKEASWCSWDGDNRLAYNKIIKALGDYNKNLGSYMPAVVRGDPGIGTSNPFGPAEVDEGSGIGPSTGPSIQNN